MGRGVEKAVAAKLAEREFERFSAVSRSAFDHFQNRLLSCILGCYIFRVNGRRESQAAVVQSSVQ